MIEVTQLEISDLNPVRTMLVEVLQRAWTPIQILQIRSIIPACPGSRPYWLRTGIPSQDMVQNPELGDSGQLPNLSVHPCPTCKQRRIKCLPHWIIVRIVYSHNALGALPCTLNRVH